MPAGRALSAGERFSLGVQRGAGRILSPFWIPACAALVRFAFRWRIEGVEESRREFRRLRRASTSPLMVCANHLTMVDSFLIALALGSPGWFVRHYASLPWNVPERDHFAHTWWMQILVYVMKCIPVKRGGDRRALGLALERFVYLLSRGEVGLIFPEGGRSRTRRVDVEATTYGAGRVIRRLPGCRVLCVYLRGEGQETYSNVPARGERFRVRIETFEPKSDRSGLRGSLEVTRQILMRLASMEEQHFGRQ